MIRIASFLLCLMAAGGARADDMTLTLRTATSPQLSGLFDHILPIFKAASNLSVHVVQVDPDKVVVFEDGDDTNALLLNDVAAAKKLVADGLGVGQQYAFYDDVVIVGPRSDPAGIRGINDAPKAFTQIAAKGAPFVRGSDSRTGRTELALWKSAGVEPDKGSPWYRDAGQGTQAALSLAATTEAYTLTERATWTNFKNRQNLEILAEGDPLLLNVYMSILINPEREARNKYIYAHIWYDWLNDKHGDAAIASYKVNGEQVFFPCQGSAATLCQKAVAAKN